MYVAVKGGERAIDNAHRWLAEERRGDTSVAELTLEQIREQLKIAVNRVMAEGSLYDPDLAALAIKQARGDVRCAAAHIAEPVMGVFDRAFAAFDRNIHRSALHPCCAWDRREPIARRQEKIDAAREQR
ncbi:MAG: carbon-phosphorus lyase complex subunit PhnI, partial [Pseudomonadota bacterium]